MALYDTSLSKFSPTTLMNDEPVQASSSSPYDVLLKDFLKYIATPSAASGALPTSSAQQFQSAPIAKTAIPTVPEKAAKSTPAAGALPITSGRSNELIVPETPAQMYARIGYTPELTSPDLAEVIGGVPRGKLPEYLQGFTTDQLTKIAKQYGMTLPEFAEYEYYGSAKNALREGILEQRQASAQRPFDEVLAELQYYKENPPQTYEDVQKANIAFRDYEQRYANSTWNYPEMGGRPQDYSLRPIGFLPTTFTEYSDPYLRVPTPQGQELPSEYTQFSPQINDYLNRLSREASAMSNTVTGAGRAFDNIRTIKESQALLQKYPAISEIINAVYSIDPNFQKYSPLDDVAIKNLASEIEQYGSRVAAAHLINRAKGLVGFGQDNWYGQHNMDNPYYAAYEQLLRSLEPKKSDEDWRESVATAYRGNNPKIVGNIWRDPVSGSGFGLTEGRGMQFYNRSGEQAYFGGTHIEDFIEEARRLGMDLTKLDEDTRNQINAAFARTSGGNLADYGFARGGLAVHHYADGGAVTKNPNDYMSLVQQAYQNILGRSPEQEGLNYWTSQLSSGSLSPEKLNENILAAAQGADIANAQRYSQNYANTLNAATQQNAATGTTQTTTGQPDDRTSYLSSNPQVQGDGGTYDVNTLLKLSQQIVPNLGELRGGIFGTKGESVGFSYDTAKQILGRAPTTGEQVVLDMARSLMSRGITDLSQVSVKDVLGEGRVYEITDDSGPSGRYQLSMPDLYGEGSGINRELTPEEVARIQTRQRETGEGTETEKYLSGLVLGKGLYSPSGLLAQSPTNDALSLTIGKTYSGPGMTGYNMIVNPTTGKIQFTTYGQDTGEGQLVSAALAVASFIPGVAPFAQAANAAIAISQGNTLGGLASLAGLGGFSNVATALNVANSIQSNNPMGIVSALVNNPTISNSVSNINLAGNITLSDVARAASLANAVSKQDWTTVAQIGGQLTNSKDLQTAASAARLVQAVATGNFIAAADAARGLQRTTDAASNITNQTVANRVAEIVNRDVTGGGDSSSVRDSIINTATSNGASLEEAIDAAEAIANVQGAVRLGSDTDEDLNNLFATELNQSIEQVDLSDFAGFNDAASRTIERNTLNISNIDANTLEEAAALAGARGYTAFNFGGNTYQMSASAATIAQQVAEQEIASQPTFADAYQIARQQLGPGQIFTWNGKQYSTDTREENPSLAAASDQLRLASQGVANGRGSYAGYDEAAVGNALASFGTFDDFLKGAGLGGEYIIVDDKVSRDLITPLVRIYGLTTRASGELAESMLGSLAAMNVIASDSPLIRAATQFKNSTSSAIGNDILQAEKNVFDRVGKADGAVNKGAELFRAMWDNPITMFTLPFNEGVQEIVPLLTGMSAAKWFGTIAGLATSAGLNAAEAAGANYNETLALAQRAGMTPGEAHSAAQKSALAAGTVAAILGPAAELPFIKRAAGDVVSTTLGDVVKRSATAAGREAVTEYPEEALASVAADYFATGTFDPNKALTQATIASVTAGKTVGAFSVVNDVLADKPATDQIIYSGAISESQRPIVDQTITTALQNNQNLADVGLQISSSLTQSGINEDQANNIANTVVAEQFLANVRNAQSEDSEFSIADLNQAVGIDSKGNPVTVADVIGSSITNRGNETFLSPDIAIGTNSEGGILTIGDLSTIQGVTSSTSAATNATSETTREGDVTSTTNTDSNTGTTTTTQTDTQTNITTETTVAGDTKTTTTTDPNNNTATRTEVNTNTNTQTTTTNDANTNTVTQTTVDTNANTTTEVTIDTTTDTTTQVTTDNNTNTQTTVYTDTATNTQITTVVDTITGEVIDETITTTPDDWEPPKVDPPKVTPPKTGGGGGRLIPIPLGIYREKEYISDDDLTFKDPFISSLVGQEKFKGTLDPFLAQVQADRFGREFGQLLDQNMREGQDMMNYFTYGVPVEIDQVFNPVPKSFKDLVPENDEEPTLMAAAKGGLATPLMAQGGYAGGGLPLVAHSGKARVDFREGAAVSGPGDGQSDDIPAMLADGEFVFPADVVAALGNGSTKAGSDKLYDMMHSIRAHHRSARPQDLPPPAKKNPLDYLKKARR